uniref:SH2 domain containing 2A n=1 Tax=Terrapene triunguis TaxID=2587831 RepID=A0A674KAE5_9SAUR
MGEARGIKGGCEPSSEPCSQTRDPQRPWRQLPADESSRTCWVLPGSDRSPILQGGLFPGSPPPPMPTKRPSPHDCLSRTLRRCPVPPAELRVPGASPPRAGSWHLARAPSALQARTRAWFERTQASRIRQQGELPPWFHGFISRSLSFPHRDTEQLLQETPHGSFLIRFSESTVGFVLSYRGRDRCRHFILDQLEDECYVILGEDSAHAELQGLLQHYTTAPVTPYYEFLTAPCPRVRERLAQSRPSSPMQEAGASADPYAHVSKAPVPAEQPTPAQPAEAKYQQLMRFHTYAEPREGFPSPERRIYYEPDEPIPFYAMGRGSLPSPDPENVYAEVELACRPRPQALPRVLQDTASTLPRGSSRPPAEPSPGHRRLLRSTSGQGSRRRQLPAALTIEGDRGRPSGPSSEVGARWKDKWGAAL